MESYHFKKIDRASLAEVADLIQKVVGKRFSAAHLAKKFASPEADGQFGGWLAIEKASTRAVAVVSALPFLAALPDGRTVRAVQIHETFTLPEHAGRGLMTRLAQLVMEEQKRAGARLFFAITNQNNVHGFVKKLGFSKTHEMRHFTIRTGAFPLEAICRRLGFLGFFRRWAERSIRPFSASPSFVLPNSATLEGWVGIVHDEGFFDYKSFSINELCLFEGIGSWLKMETGLLVGDVLLAENCSDEQFEKWLARLQKLAQKMGLRQIVFQTFDESRLCKKLEKRLASGPSWSVCALAADAEMEPFLEKMRFGYGDFDTF